MFDTIPAYNGRQLDGYCTIHICYTGVL